MASSCHEVHFLFILEFNAVTRTCLQDLVPAILRHLNLPKSKGKDAVLPSASPHWKKIRINIRTYVGDVIEVYCICYMVKLVIIECCHNCHLSWMGVLVCLIIFICESCLHLVVYYVVLFPRSAKSVT